MTNTSEEDSANNYYYYSWVFDRRSFGIRTTISPRENKEAPFSMAIRNVHAMRCCWWLRSGPCTTTHSRAISGTCAWERQEWNKWMTERKRGKKRRMNTGGSTAGTKKKKKCRRPNFSANKCIHYDRCLTYRQKLTKIVKLARLHNMVM